MSREPGLVTVLPNEEIYFKAVIHMLLMCRMNTVGTNTEHVLFCVCDSESFLETSFSVVRGCNAWVRMPRALCQGWGAGPQ